RSSDLELDVAGDGLVQAVGKGVQGLPQGGEPLAVVDDVGVLLGQLGLEVGALLVQGDGLQDVDGLVEDGAAGGLVDAAALHAHQAVLDDVQQADAVLAANLVQAFQQVHG